LGQAPANQTGQETSVRKDTNFAFQEFTNTPRTPAQMPLPRIPDYPGAVPHPFPPVPGIQGAHAQPVAPKRARPGRSVGCIVLYAFLAITLIFVALGIALHEIGVQIAKSDESRNDVTKAAAMRLYQQVTGTKPDIEGSADTPTSLSTWSYFQNPT